MEPTHPHTEPSEEPEKRGLQAIEKTLQLPLDDEELATLRAGEWVLVSGTMLLLSPAAAFALGDLWDEELAQTLLDDDATIFFAQSGDAPLGKVIGSVEPSTPLLHAMLCCALLDADARCIIGSGPLNADVLERLKKKRGVYLTTVSSAGALLARTVHQAEVVACESLGLDAVRRVKVSRLPCMITLDGFGRNLLSRTPQETQT